MSSRAPRCGAVTNSTARSGASPIASTTWPTTSPVASVAIGCCDSAAANGTSVGNRGEERVGHDHRVAEIDAAVGLDGAVVIEGELGADEPVVELAGFDRQ